MIVSLLPAIVPTSTPLPAVDVNVTVPLMFVYVPTSSEVTSEPRAIAQIRRAAAVGILTRSMLAAVTGERKQTALVASTCRHRAAQPERL
jgi:hypothetical protein